MIRSCPPRPQRQRPNSQRHNGESHALPQKAPLVPIDDFNLVAALCWLFVSGGQRSCNQKRHGPCQARPASRVRLDESERVVPDTCRECIHHEIYRHPAGQAPHQRTASPVRAREERCRQNKIDGISRNLLHHVQGVRSCLNSSQEQEVVIQQKGHQQHLHKIQRPLPV